MAKKKNKGETASPIPPSRAIETSYRVQLNKLGRAFMKAVREQVLNYLKINYTPDSISADLSRIFKRLFLQAGGVLTESFAEVSATEMVEKVDENNKERFNKSVAAATGIDLGNVIQVEGLEDYVALSINKNVSLIKSLPQQYLTQVETIVNNGLVSGARYSTIEKEITALVGSANAKLANRIKTIARNEVQTINAQLTLQRSKSLGITKGIYRTSEDERVRPCHAELNGVEYELDKGAWSKTCQKYIQPGITDINCRCDYSPVIELD